MPIKSLLTITAGRVFRISDPTVGSRFTSQISPLFIFVISKEEVVAIEGIEFI